MITAGIDEVGRGCWAGPLVAGAVVLREDIAGLCDSKKLKKSQREALDTLIRTSSASVGLGWVFPEEIDQIGLSAAVALAMQRALDEVINMHDTEIDEIIIDGNINYLFQDTRTQAIIKADNTVPAVSAASIVAKVARDRWMATEACSLYPEYEFDTHVGYGTKRHIELLKHYGVTSIHRKSYKPIKALL